MSAQQGGDSLAGTVVVSGTVYNSLEARPLGGAVVQLASSDLQGRVWNDRADSLGNFRISGIRPGEYILGIIHPFLDSLGLGLPAMKLSVAASDTTRLSLAIPSASAVRTRFCPTAHSSDSSAILLGSLRDAATGDRIVGGTVRLEWVELVLDHASEKAHVEQRSMTAESTGTGWYTLCGIPAGQAVRARAKVGEDASGYISIDVPARGVLHRDFSIARGSSDTAVASGQSGDSGERLLHRGHASLTGVVQNENGAPLDGAQVTVWGTELTATSRDDGTFTLSLLPAGTQTVEVRHIGYAPERAVIDLVNERTRSITLALTQRADVLDDVTVYGQDRLLASKLRGFDQRRALGFGHFMTRADIRKQHPLRFTDLLRSTPGVKVVPEGGLEYAIVSTRGNCKTAIYLNGARLKDPSGIDFLVDPNEVAAIELYAGITDTPPQFGRGQCGSVVIWTFPNLKPIDEEP